MEPLTLTYSLADQNFNHTKSVGIFNVSTQLLENLISRRHFQRIKVLGNSTLNSKLCLPSDIDIEQHDGAVKSRLGRVHWDQWGVYAAAKRSGNEWLLLPKGFASFLRKPDFKLAVYVYDSVHEFYRVNYPNAMPWFEIEYFTRSLKSTFKYSKVIFTDSDFAKGELERLALKFKLPSPPIITAGIGFVRNREKILVKRDFLLLLTSSWPHKFTKKAVGFIERWQKENSYKGGVELVGTLPSSMAVPHCPGWHHSQRLSETEYRQLLTEARALLFFSGYEGFGMPPVEAMISGTCPVFSDLPVTREVMRGMGFTFSNYSYESFAKALNEALRVSAAQIRFWGEQLLEYYNWNKVVERVVKGLLRAEQRD
ncbi:MAG: glycosyltransferase [Candidatus Omnitrophota bacterium]